MQKIIISILVFSVFTQVSCQNNATSNEASTQSETSSDYISKGDQITDTDALNIPDFLATVEKHGGADPIKVKGTINDCCQKKGCWMNVDLQNGEEMMVRFKDYGFFVPLDAAGKEVVMQGKAYYDTLDVATLKHYAEDKGLPQEEIDKITEPQPKLAFEATGVLIR